MKHYLLILLAVGTIAPLSAMGKKPTTKQAKKSSKKAKESFLETYVDLGDLIISIGRAYKRKKTDAASLSVAILEAINIEKLPLELADRKTTVGEFFKGPELKECLSEFLSKWFEGKLRRRHIADVLEGLQGSLRMDAVKEEFGDDEWIDIEEGFTLLIARFGGEDVGDIADVIDLENAPKLFGFMIKDYFIIDKLNEALNDALNNEALTKSILLDCIDIEQIAEREGYDEIPNADGIREAIELFFSMMEDDEDATHKVFNILGAYRATKRVVEDSDDDSEDVRPARSRPVVSSRAKPASSSSSFTRRPQPALNARAKSAQESSDAALARRLQDDGSEDVRPARSRPVVSSRTKPASSSSSSTRRPTAIPAANIVRRPQPAQSARAKSAQESSDATLARRLQREWDNE